jgi:hypothetical protein
LKPAFDLFQRRLTSAATGKSCRFVCLAGVDPLISPAERTCAPLDFGHKPKSRSALSAAGLLADWAMQANPGQRHVIPGFYPGRHFIPVCL